MKIKNKIIEPILYTMIGVITVNNDEDLVTENFGIMNYTLSQTDNKFLLRKIVRRLEKIYTKLETAHLSIEEEKAKIEKIEDVSLKAKELQEWLEEYHDFGELEKIPLEWLDDFIFHENCMISLFEEYFCE